MNYGENLFTLVQMESEPPVMGPSFCKGGADHSVTEPERQGLWQGAGLRPGSMGCTASAPCVTPVSSQGVLQPVQSTCRGRMGAPAMSHPAASQAPPVAGLGPQSLQRSEGSRGTGPQASSGQGSCSAQSYQSCSKPLDRGGAAGRGVAGSELRFHSRAVLPGTVAASHRR